MKDLTNSKEFIGRHIGPSDEHIKTMLSYLNVKLIIFQANKRKLFLFYFKNFNITLPMRATYTNLIKPFILSGIFSRV
jgi:hypothetical protein